MVRMPAVAGMFYPGNIGELDQKIKECFVHDKKGPAEMPVAKRENKIIGVIAPHAGYQFSGACQAWAYKEIAEAEFSGTYIILGTGHSGLREASITTEEFQTPLGLLNVDQRITKALLEKGVVKENKEAHKQEHSIEVQLPFLQFVNKNFIGSINIVPIIIGGKIDYEKLGKAIASVVKQSKVRPILICSTDFTHHGLHYGFAPFRRHANEQVKELDLGVIEYIEKLDTKGFVACVKQTGASICGAFAVAAFLEACKGLGAKKARLEQYYTSADVTKDKESIVGYAAIVVE